MAKTEKQENVIQEVKTEETPVQVPVEEQKQEEPKIKARILEEGGDFKFKPRKLKQEVDKKEIVQEPEKEEKVETKKEEKKEESILEEVTEEEIAEAKKVEAQIIVEEKPVEEKQPEVVVPENLQDLVKFMEDTGGSLEDYTRLNADYSTVDDTALLREYYKNTKPHLDMEEIN